jgi:hypothetical protein
MFLVFFQRLRLRPLYIIPTFVVTFISEVANMKFVGVREFKEDVVKGRTIGVRSTLLTRHLKVW